VIKLNAGEMCETVYTPPGSNALRLFFSCTQIQQSVQKYVWDGAAKPVILCAAGLSHAIATRITRTSRPN
jgi:hypothetical protein